VKHDKSNNPRQNQNNGNSQVHVLSPWQSKFVSAGSFRCVLLVGCAIP
jgi:hypothetical protein